MRGTLRLFSLSVALAFQTASVCSHGYLKTPRSRNFVAFQDKNWQTYYSGVGGEADPMPEDCVHCLNRGGTMAQCGVIDARNYDRPENGLGLPLGPNVQGTYAEGETIEVEVMVTTHHKGHFVFSACPLLDSVSDFNGEMPVPTAECFERHQLRFVEDELYGAPADPRYPERAYIVPADKAQWMSGDPGELWVYGAYYKMKFELPVGVYGDVVLLQWYYLTANSCKHDGYFNYTFPSAWGEYGSSMDVLPDCGVIPPDGNGVPEQFWNCAEIKIDKSAELEVEEVIEEKDGPVQFDPKPEFSATVTNPPTRAQPKRPITRPAASPPTILPTDAPVTQNPSDSPSQKPTRPPSRPPTKEPSPPPSREPTPRPVATRKPTAQPSRTKEPTANPSDPPSRKPTRPPSRAPTKKPSRPPSREPTSRPVATRRPTAQPSKSKESASRRTKEPTAQPIAAATFAQEMEMWSKPNLRKTRPPTNKPVSMLIVPTTVSTNEVTQRPTKRKNKNREPTQRPTTPNAPSIAQSFAFAQTSFVMLPPTETIVVEVKPFKGKEGGLQGGKAKDQIGKAKNSKQVKRKKKRLKATKKQKRGGNKKKQKKQRG